MILFVCKMSSFKSSCAHAKGIIQWGQLFKANDVVSLRFVKIYIVWNGQA